MANLDRIRGAGDPELEAALRCLKTATAALRQYVANIPADTKSVAAQALRAVEKDADQAGGKVRQAVNGTRAKCGDAPS